jgi:hypothetical protein
MHEIKFNSRRLRHLPEEAHRGPPFTQGEGDTQSHALPPRLPRGLHLPVDSHEVHVSSLPSAPTDAVAPAAPGL